MDGFESNKSLKERLEKNLPKPVVLSQGDWILTDKGYEYVERKKP